MDMRAAYARAAHRYAPKSARCIDPFHAGAEVTEALDKVRSAEWNALRATDPGAAQRFQDARWVLLKNRINLTDD